MLDFMRKYLTESAAPVYRAWTDSYLHAWLAARGLARPACPPYTSYPPAEQAVDAPTPAVDYVRMHELELQLREEAQQEAFLESDMKVLRAFVVLMYTFLINWLFCLAFLVYDRLMRIKNSSV
ncbi:hypothetical protein EWM64_g6825 [Hericium alpestre]|uniref:Uncharacterized protein n=1 Tax=Hericium alpestre TaxID=135208 RepID=A0A4Y9ZUL8_9AGAM|nr:hypothetical protein EWM64_g6825 [Hericium alpestre]